MQKVKEFKPEREQFNQDYDAWLNKINVKLVSLEILDLSLQLKDSQQMEKGSSLDNQRK